jgi:hypothetical protein
MDCEDLNIELFFQEDLGNLSEVRYISDEEFRDSPSAVLMYFSSTVIMVRVVTEDDSVEIIPLDFNVANNLDSINVSSDVLWKDAIDAKLQWVWGLINQQGYADGIQFEWIQSISQRRITIQLIAASWFQVHKVERIN